MLQGNADFEGDAQGQGAEAGGPDDHDPLHLDLVIEDREIITILNRKKPGRERDAYAVAALKVGILALAQAEGRIDGERIRSEGTRLIETFDGALKAHREGLTGDIARSLADYFDPQSGRLSQRVEKLIQKDGDLETVIRGQIAGDGSLLARTLNAHLGENSPLLDLLDPRSEKGLAVSLAKSVDRAAREQRDAMMQEFSLDNPAGALSRTLRELTQKHDAAGATLAEKINVVVAEFSLDKKDSALSRLVQRVETAQRTLSDEFSLDKDGSALARMRKELLDQISLLAKTQNEFQTDIISQLKEMSARKAQSLKSTTHGLEFEDALFAHIQKLTQARGDIATQTGNVAGRIRHQKLGDIVVELGPDHSAAGARVVIEAKQNKSVDLAAARREIEQARINRDAAIGIFVYSSRCAPSGLAGLTRFGSDIFLIWDAEDAATDLILEVGLSLATAMIMHGVTDMSEHSADFDAIERALLGVQKQIDGLEAFEKYADTITGASDKIRDRTRKMRDALIREMKTLNETVAAIKQTLE